MPWSPNYYRPPRIYAETMARRRRDAQRAAERHARANQQRIAGVIEEHGERMGDGGRGLLMELAEAFKKIGEAMRGK